MSYFTLFGIYRGRNNSEKSVLKKEKMKKNEKFIRIVDFFEKYRETQAVFCRFSNDQGGSDLDFGRIIRIHKNSYEIRFSDDSQVNILSRLLLFERVIWISMSKMSPLFF